MKPAVNLSCLPEVYFLSFLSLQIDGFVQTVNVKVIMASNRADTLDPALLCPGRLDLKIEFPLPDRRQKKTCFPSMTSDSLFCRKVIELEPESTA